MRSHANSRSSELSRSLSISERTWSRSDIPVTLKSESAREARVDGEQIGHDLVEIDARGKRFAVRDEVAQLIVLHDLPPILGALIENEGEALLEAQPREARPVGIVDIKRRPLLPVPMALPPAN